MRKLWGPVCGTLVLVAVTLTAQPSTQSRDVVFVGASLVDVAAGRLVENAALVVRDGRVAAAGPAAAVRPPAGARTVDLAGCFVVPGFISAHVHVSDVHGDRPRAHTDENTRRQLGVFARYGITSVLSLEGEGDPGFRARDGQDAPGLDRARLFLSGEAIGAATPDEARHRLGLRVAAHIFYLDDAKDLLRAGVDVIAHSVRDRDIDEEFIALMKARDVPYCPTLTRELSTFVYGSTPEFFSDPFFLREADASVMTRLRDPARQEAMATSPTAQAYRAGLAVARRNLKRAADAGVLVVMGTDAGPLPERFQGYFEHLEMEMMAEAGLTPAQILRAASLDAAKAIEADGVGALVDGAWADFVALGRNPLDDIRHTRSITGVWIAGNEVAR